MTRSDCVPLNDYFLALAALFVREHAVSVSANTVSGRKREERWRDGSTDTHPCYTSSRQVGPRRGHFPQISRCTPGALGKEFGGNCCFSCVLPSSSSHLTSPDLVPGWVLHCTRWQKERGRAGLPNQGFFAPMAGTYQVGLTYLTVLRTTRSEEMAEPNLVICQASDEAMHRGHFLSHCTRLPLAMIKRRVGGLCPPHSS